jgi:hypothetical protein
MVVLLKVSKKGVDLRKAAEYFAKLDRNESKDWAMLDKHRESTGKCLNNRHFAERSRGFSMNLNACVDAECSAPSTRARDTVGQGTTHPCHRKIGKSRRESLSTSWRLRAISHHATDHARAKPCSAGSIWQTTGRV